MSRRAALVVSEGTNGVGRGGGANVRLKPGAGDNIDRAVEQAGDVFFQFGVIEDGDVRGRIKLLGTSAHRGAHLEPQSGLDHACDTAIRIAGVIRSFADRRTAAIWVDRMPKGFPNDLARVARRKLRMLESATRLEDLRNPPGNRLERLVGDLRGRPPDPLRQVIPAASYAPRLGH